MSPASLDDASTAVEKLGADLFFAFADSGSADVIAMAAGEVAYLGNCGSIYSGFLRELAVQRGTTAEQLLRGHATGSGPSLADPATWETPPTGWADQPVSSRLLHPDETPSEILSRLAMVHVGFALPEGDWFPQLGLALCIRLPDGVAWCIATDHRRPALVTSYWDSAGGNELWLVPGASLEGQVRLASIDSAAVQAAIQRSDADRVVLLVDMTAVEDRDTLLAGDLDDLLVVEAVSLDDYERGLEQP